MRVLQTRIGHQRARYDLTRRGEISIERGGIPYESGSAVGIGVMEIRDHSRMSADDGIKAWSNNVPAWTCGVAEVALRLEDFLPRGSVLRPCVRDGSQLEDPRK